MQLAKIIVTSEGLDFAGTWAHSKAHTDVVLIVQAYAGAAVHVDNTT